MTDKAIRSNKAGLVDPPVYPCYKDKGGLCQLRTMEKPKRFECVQSPDACRYMRKGNDGKGKGANK